MVKFFPSCNVFHNGEMWHPGEGHDIREDEIIELSPYGSIVSPPPVQQQETLFVEPVEEVVEVVPAPPVKRKAGRPKKGESFLLATATKEELANL